MTEATDRRTDARFLVAMRGRMVLKGHAWPCTVLDISAAGAALRCRLPGGATPLQPVLLHLDGIGRLEAAIIQAAPDDVLRLSFTCDAARRGVLTAALTDMLDKGQARPVRRRRQDRVAMTNFPVLRANGETLPCAVLDISLHGICLATPARPPVGETVSVAGRSGQVVRHHARGIAIRLTAEAPTGISRPPLYPIAEPAPGHGPVLDDCV